MRNAHERFGTLEFTKRMKDHDASPLIVVTIAADIETQVYLVKISMEGDGKIAEEPSVAKLETYQADVRFRRMNPTQFPPGRNGSKVCCQLRSSTSLGPAIQQIGRLVFPESDELRAMPDRIDLSVIELAARSFSFFVATAMRGEHGKPCSGRRLVGL